MEQTSEQRLPDCRACTVSFTLPSPGASVFPQSNKRTMPAPGLKITSRKCWVSLEISPGEQNRSYSCRLQGDKEGHLQLEKEQKRAGAEEGYYTL